MAPRRADRSSYGRLWRPSCSPGVLTPRHADQTPGNLPAGAAPPSQDFANGKPSAAQKAMQDAIPLTPEMIEELGRRFNATQRAREEAVTPLAAPLNRQINVSFAPGAATSIINTVKGYPTAVCVLRQHRSALAHSMGHQQQPGRGCRRHELQRAEQHCGRAVGGGDRLLCLHADEGQQCAWRSRRFR